MPFALLTFTDPDGVALELIYMLPPGDEPGLSRERCN
jgi:hypothetical protein